MREFSALIAMALPVGAEGISFSIETTRLCLEGAEGLERFECIGASAGVCMETTEGTTTVGMGFCIGLELGFWDEKLNMAYADLRSVERSVVDTVPAGGPSVPDSAKALRDMQRAWMGYRDAACFYEYSTWGGGTGGGPANAACLLDLTARQSLVLEDRLQEHVQ